MERVKVALLAIIAVALVAPQLTSLIPTAQAESGGEVTCYAVPQANIVAVKPEKGVEEAATNLGALQAFLRAHPGEIVYRSIQPRPNGAGHLETICIR